MCLCILEEDRQDEGKVTALVARLQQKAKEKKSKETREEHKREQNKTRVCLCTRYFAMIYINTSELLSFS
jgi:hypothetical protein